MSPLDPTARHEAEQKRLATLVRAGRDEVKQHAECSACGQSFGVAAGELMFAERTGVPAPTLCRRCRPTRRAALAAPKSKVPGDWSATCGSRARKYSLARKRVSGCGGDVGGR